jgi:hypothetical protein
MLDARRRTLEQRTLKDTRKQLSLTRERTRQIETEASTKWPTGSKTPRPAAGWRLVSSSYEQQQLLLFYPFSSAAGMLRPVHADLADRILFNAPIFTLFG